MQFAYDSMSGSLWQNVVDTARTGGANWSPYPPAPGVFRIFENKAYCEISGALYHEAVPPSADYAVQATYVLKTDMSTMSVAGRMQLGALSFYMAFYSGGSLQLAKYVAGTYTLLDSAATPWVAGAQNYLHWYPQLRRLLLDLVTSDGRGTVRAVVIGIDAYRHVRPLKGATADARDLVG